MDLAEILARVVRRLSALRLTDNAASQAAGKPDAIRNLRRAVKASRKGVSTATIAALAPALKTTAAWLLEGKGPEEPGEVPNMESGEVPRTRVVGYAGAGALTHFYALPGSALDEVESPPDATSKTVAVEIRGESLGLMFDRWYAFFDDVRSPVTDDLVGRLCVVGLSDERVLIKKLRRGSRPGLYRLLSKREPAIEDAQVTWAARVKHMSPR